MLLETRGEHPIFFRPTSFGLRSIGRTPGSDPGNGSSTLSARAAATAAHVHRQFPEQMLTAERQRHGASGGMTNEFNDNEAYPRLAMPLLRRWSARLAEAQEVLVRFQGVARHAARRMRRRCVCQASVAPRQSSRFLPGSVLVRVQPEARLRVRPTGEVTASRADPGEFDSHDPLHARAV